MTTKFQAADQMVDQMLHRFLELIFKIPFESWDHVGQEFLSVIMAYTILLAYGKILSAIGHAIILTFRKIFLMCKKGWSFLWIEGCAPP